MGLCCSKPDGQPPPTSFSSASPAATAAAARVVAGEAHIVERKDYDTDMRQHLISHSTPHKVELTIAAAAVFAARARLAHSVVAKRQTESGCESSVALARSPSALAHKEEALRLQMSREEKIADGLKLLIQRVDNVVRLPPPAARARASLSCLRRHQCSW
jgi:predicted phage-related endonuclease